jgi:hypothetical protein
MATWDVDVLRQCRLVETHFRILGYEPVPGGAAARDVSGANPPRRQRRVIDALNEARRGRRFIGWLSDIFAQRRCAAIGLGRFRQAAGDSSA